MLLKITIILFVLAVILILILSLTTVAGLADKRLGYK
jgi:hypothetical protein